MQPNKADSPRGSPRSRNPIPGDSLPPWTTGKAKLPADKPKALQPQDRVRPTDSAAQLASDAKGGQADPSQAGQGTHPVQQGSHVDSSETLLLSSHNQTSTDPAHPRQSGVGPSHSSPVQHATSRRAAAGSRLTDSFHSPTQPAAEARDSFVIPGSAQLRQLTHDLESDASPARLAVSADPTCLPGVSGTRQSTRLDSQPPRLAPDSTAYSVHASMSPANATGSGKAVLKPQKWSTLPDQALAAAVGRAVTTTSLSAASRVDQPGHRAGTTAEDITSFANDLAHTVDLAHADVTGITAQACSSTATYTSRATGRSQGTAAVKAAVNSASAPASPAVASGSGRSTVTREGQAAWHSRLHARQPTQLTSATSGTAVAAAPAWFSPGRTPSKRQHKGLGTPKLHDAVRARLIGSAPNSPAYASRPQHATHAHTRRAMAGGTGLAEHVRQCSDSPVQRRGVSAGLGCRQVSAAAAAAEEVQVTGEAQVSSTELPDQQTVAASGQVLELWQELQAASHDLQRGKIKA